MKRITKNGSAIHPMRTKRAGFSLVEINLTLLIVGVGLVALLSLFPVGLRQAGLATADTVQAVFADRVLNTLHAKACQITNWTDWVAFESKVLQGASIDGSAIKANREEIITPYLNVTDSAIRYRLTFQTVDAPHFKGRLKRAAIQVSERAEGDLTRATIYCTDFVFQGPPPR
jgi:uncharacterized protein (TIGR02598 family)